MRSFLVRMLVNEAEIKNLSVQHRLHILRIMGRGNMRDNITNYNFTARSEEELALLIFNQCPKEQYAAFLSGLKEKDNENTLLGNLISKMDDMGGSKNYTGMINIMVKMINESPDRQSKLEAMLSPENFENRLVRWDIDRNLTKAAAEKNLGALKYDDIKFDSRTGKVSFTKWRLEKSEWYELPGRCPRPDGLCKNTEYTFEEYGTATLDPFDYIYFMTYNNRTAYEDPTEESIKEIKCVPAIYLYYYNREDAINKGIQSATVAADVATIMTGPGALVKAVSAFRKGLVIFELAVATGNLAANTFGSSNEVFLQTLQASNAVMGIIGIKTLGTQAAKINMVDAEDRSSSRRPQHHADQRPGKKFHRDSQ